MPSNSPPKLHLNEHLSPRLAVQLRNHGFDVTTSQGGGLLATPDEQQLEFAADQERAIVTFNIRDFSELHEKLRAAKREHWGIVLSTREKVPLLFHRLLCMLNKVSAEELKNRLIWLNDFK